jgi:uncharacterized NAD-dependent epimerase/dehydratase family protein
MEIAAKDPLRGVGGATVDAVPGAWGADDRRIEPLPAPYLVFLGGASDAKFAKTALGLRDWAREHCVGEWGLDGATIGLPAMDPAIARARGARALIIGVANVGGAIDPRWREALFEALAAGLDIVSGMHGALGDDRDLAAAATRHGRRLIDLRTPKRQFPVASGAKRGGKRLLTVGTDCALGKKYTALALVQAFRERGVDVDFRATGQTGIMIAGDGVAIDAVVGDFMAGAAECLSPQAAAEHWDVIEGQGSIFHPAYAGVTLALLHGSQPDCIVVCHAIGRTHLSGYDAFPVRPLDETIDLYLRLARVTNPNVFCGGVALNTSAVDSREAERELRRITEQLGLPAADPVRRGVTFERLVDYCLKGVG